MTAVKVNGDFSKHPAEIRDIYPYIYGELCELRSSYEVYRELFMTDRKLTETLGQCFGSTLGVLQRLLAETLFLSIGCLTDKDSQKNKNLSMWSLADRCENWNPDVAKQIRDGLNQLDDKIGRIRKHRHKRLAHYDLSTSLGLVSLPVVTYTEIEETMKALEALLNVVEYHAVDGTIFFDMLEGREITRKSEVSAYKVNSYDDLVRRKIIDSSEWKKFQVIRE